MQWFQNYSDETRRGFIPKYSHEPSVHVIGGISRRGPTSLIVFEGNMDSLAFQNLCTRFLLPFIARTYPDGHYLHMDNAPSHRSASTTNFLLNSGINHWKTPAQSPDMNPIELVWNDMKTFLHTDIKPNSKEELINGIHQFWDTKVTVDYCNRKINHLYRVVPEVIRLNGKPTGL